jgi:predicted AAA+ superfamily ATPase
MVPRTLTPALLEAARQYPIVTLTGPRQSGKTTLCRAVFPGLAYVSLEAHDVRAHARTDPRGFLANLRHGAILDEVQHVPELLSYLQGLVDDQPQARGRFVLTGSQHFGLLDSVSQSLAGRTAILHLMPLSQAELAQFDSPPTGIWHTLFAGGYPAIHDRGIPPARWLRDYVSTYVQRDVRQVLQIGDLEAFTTFLRLAAGRTSQVINLSALGGDAGVSHNTARSWLSVLETGFLIQRLSPWGRNLRKQLVRARRLHFLDVGLVCHLLGLRTADELITHPLRGAVFESWVAGEITKAFHHAGESPRLAYFRDHRGLEVDLVIELADQLTLVEVKSGATVHPSMFKPLQSVRKLAEATGSFRKVRNVLVYGGEQRMVWHDVEVLPWTQVSEFDWR